MAVYVAAMSHLHNHYEDFVVINLIQDAVVANADAVSALGLIRERPGPARPGVVLELEDSVPYPMSKRLGQTLNALFDRPWHSDGIRHLRLEPEALGYLLKGAPSLGFLLGQHAIHSH